MLFSTPDLDTRELQVLAHIEEMKRSLRNQLFEPRRWYGSLRRLSIARAIQGSNSIEGFDANLEDAAAVAVGEEPLTADQETRLALQGYRETMTYILQVADDPDFAYSSQVLKSMHFMMTSYDLANRPGRWRAGSVYVRNDETEEIVYEGPDIDLVPGLMADLSDALNGPCDKRIIQAALAHLNLVMIHPFRDGNGRMARCLQSLALARGGVLAPVFMSIEEYLGRNTQAYYDVLGQVGGGSWHPENDARPWIRFSLTAHMRQARTMLRRVRETERLWREIDRLRQATALPERVMPVVFDAASGLRVRNATYRASIEDTGDEAISEQTASRDLQKLVEVGLLRPVGEKRARFYAGSSQVMQLRRDIIAARDPRDESDPFAN
jgi:Fic family protein